MSCGLTALLPGCRCLGVTGVSPVYKLHYVDANNVWLFAPSHTALLSPLKDFWKHLLDPWSKPGEPVAQLLTKNVTGHEHPPQHTSQPVSVAAK